MTDFNEIEGEQNQQPEPATVSEIEEGGETPDTFARAEAAIFDTANEAGARLENTAKKWLNQLSGPEKSTAVAQTAAEQPATYQDRRIFYWALLIVLLIDLGSKLLIEQLIPLGESLVPLEQWYPFFQLSHVANTGAAFGLFPGRGEIFSLLGLVVAFFIAGLNYNWPTKSPLLRLVLGVIVGGALGNVIDRFRLGHVTDFLNFNLQPLLNLDWPLLDWAVFNFADMCVVFGGITLAILLQKNYKELAIQEQQQVLQKMIEAGVVQELQRQESESARNGDLNEHRLPDDPTSPQSRSAPTDE